MWNPVINVVCIGCVFAAASLYGQQPKTKNQTVRFATYNVSMHGKQAGEIQKRLQTRTDPQFRKIAEVIQRVRPDAILLNEFDYQPGSKSARLFKKNFLSVSQNNQKPILFRHFFAGPVNTGIDSGLDLDSNGKKGEGNDCFGFGLYPGQYGMVVLSRFPINTEHVRTFQKFLWADMPSALWPVDPQTNQQYYSPEIKKVFRLSSKSHWDVPVKISNGKIVHFLVSHPTPPVFDGPEDRNGRRNHDEIRLWSDYVSGQANYLYDDSGQYGGLDRQADFVIAGDLNADPHDGDSYDGAINQLLENPFVCSDKTPASEGGTFYSVKQGYANKNHVGDPAHDTGDFNERVGNVRIDYCLPSKTLDVKSSGVFWPKPDQPGADLLTASDHRLVWIDLSLEK